MREREQFAAQKRYNFICIRKKGYKKATFNGKWIKSNKLVSNKFITGGVRHALMPIECYRKNAIFQDLSSKTLIFFLPLSRFETRYERKKVLLLAYGKRV